MTKVIAALDDSPAARPVAVAAVGIADLFGAQLEAVHIRVDGGHLARDAAASAGLDLIELGGDPAARLIEAAGREGVAAVVVGARGTPGGRRPAGSTALQVITAVRKPVVVVPPILRERYRVRRVLVPLETRAATAAALRGVIELACERDLHVVVLNVLEEARIPPFTNHLEHETDAWVEEFVACYCPEGRRRIQVELRAGIAPEEILEAAAFLDTDLIALAWSQDLARTAAVVRASLRRSPVPVMLLPVDERQGQKSQGGGPAVRGEPVGSRSGAPSGGEEP